MIKHIKEFLIKLYSNQYIRFIFVGGINTLFGYGIFALFIFLKFNYTLAALFTTILGVLFNFKTVGLIVFKNKSNILIIKFICVYSLSYLLYIGLLSIFNYFKISNYIAGAILILPLSVFSFILNKIFVFKTGNQSLSAKT